MTTPDYAPLLRALDDFARTGTADVPTIIAAALPLATAEQHAAALQARAGEGWTAQREAAALARCEAATAGPWSSPWDREDAEVNYRDDSIRTASGAVVVEATWYDGERLAVTEPDAAFIAAARTDLPAAIAEIRRLRAERETDRKLHLARLTDLRRDVGALGAGGDGVIITYEAGGEERVCVYVDGVEVSNVAAEEASSPDAERSPAPATGPVVPPAHESPTTARPVALLRPGEAVLSRTPDPYIAGVVEVSKPGALLRVHEVQLTEVGRDALDVGKVPR